MTPKPAGKVQLTETLVAALNVMVIWIGDEPHYCTHGDIPQQMPSKVARMVKKARALVGESSK